MSENNESKKNQKRQFDEDQYEMLVRCSVKKDMTEWNEWRKNNGGIPILLERALLRRFHLESAILWGAHLEGAQLEGAHLEGANLDKAHLERTDLEGAHLENAHLWAVHLDGANLKSAHFENANLISAHLEDTNLIGAHLEGADLIRAYLEGANVYQTHLNNTQLKAVSVDGRTLLWDCTINEETDFTGTGLDSAKVEPRLKVTLQGNIRRKQWEKWYEEGSKLKQRYKKFIVKPFWWVSDYGRSTGRIVGCFFGLSIMFALFYYLFGLIDGQGIVANLFVDHNTPSGNPGSVSLFFIFIRAIYFSIVTMTTLGFGDMYAQHGSYLGHILLTIQVLLGYVLLGALVTRFAILFTSSGPEKK